MKTNEPFELGLIRCILGLQGTTESLPEAVRKLKKENARLQDEKRQAVEEGQRAKWDLDTANATILELLAKGGK